MANVSWLAKLFVKECSREIAEGAIQIGPSPIGHGFRLQAELHLPSPRERIFEFFSDAHQLETLTPHWLRFSVLTKRPLIISTDTLIDYQLRLHGIPVRWQSCIEVWEPPKRFVDTQTRGPYRRWRHEHRFDEDDTGTLCRDIVDYDVPGGRIVNAVFVRPQLNQIFTYRQTKLRELFPPPATTDLQSSPA